MKHIIIALFFFSFFQLYAQDSSEFNMNQISQFINAEWERKATKNEKKECDINADRFIMIIQVNDNNGCIKGTIEYFTYSNKKDSICWLEHPSESFVHFKIIRLNEKLYLDLVGWLWTEKWDLEIIDSDKIILNGEEYIRSKINVLQKFSKYGL